MFNPSFRPFNNKVAVIYIPGSAGNFLTTALTISPQIRSRVPVGLFFMPQIQQDRQNILKFKKSKWINWSRDVEGRFVLDYQSPYKFMVEQTHWGVDAFDLFQSGAYKKTILITVDSKYERDWLNASVIMKLDYKLKEKDIDIDIFNNLKQRADILVPLKNIVVSQNIFVKEIYKICNHLNIIKPYQHLLIKHWLEWKKTSPTNSNLKSIKL